MKVKVTKKRLVVCVAFPLVAISTLLFGFMCDEILGLGGSPMANAIYSAANYLYCVIFLPLSLVDIDSSSSAAFKIALALTALWWYFLACVLTFFVDRARRG